MIQQTSLLAYQEVTSRIGKRQLEVYDTLKNLGSANNHIIAKKLGWDINRVTPRVLELRKAGLVVKDAILPCPITKRMTWFWRVK